MKKIPELKIEGARDMKRSTSSLTTFLVVTLFFSAAATTASSGVAAAADAECSRWDLNGEWKLVQTNETAPTFTLQQSENALQGSATYWYTHESECVLAFCGDDYYRVDASVDGTVNGDSFEIVAYWNNGTTGVYTGKIGPQGRIQGSGYDRQHPQTMANWYSDRTAKCLVGTPGTGGRIGTTSSALGTASPEPVRAQGRVRLPGGAPAKSTLSICEAAVKARARNSPAAPGLEKSCREQQAIGASDVATAGNTVRRTPPGASPIITKSEKFGPGGAAALMLAASQPENSIRVRVRYKKELGYKGESNAFGDVGLTSCSAFSVTVAVLDTLARRRHPILISSDSRMADAGDYYMCSYVASDIPLNRAVNVTVGVSGADLSAAWQGGDAAHPPEGQQRTIPDATRTAMLNASQPRARLSYEMVYGDSGRSR
jgi:hypothetical protein